MALLADGFRTIISFALQPGLNFQEREIQPPGFSGGGGIDTTSMRNGLTPATNQAAAVSNGLNFRTKQPKSLITVEDITLQVLWDPNSLVLIIPMMQKNQNITITMPDGTTEIVAGWLEEFKPNSHKEGELPLAEMKIMLGQQSVASFPSQTAGGAGIIVTSAGSLTSTGRGGI